MTCSDIDCKKNDSGQCILNDKLKLEEIKKLLDKFYLFTPHPSGLTTLRKIKDIINGK